MKNAIVYRAVKLVAENVGAQRVPGGGGGRDARPPSPARSGGAAEPARGRRTLARKRRDASADRRQCLRRGGERGWCAARALCAAPRSHEARSPARTAGRRHTNTRSRARAVRFDQAAALPPILHLSLMHPLDDHYGLAPLEAAGVAVDTHNAAASLEQGAARQCGAALRRAGLCRAGRRGAVRRSIPAAQARTR